MRGFSTCLQASQTTEVGVQWHAQYVKQECLLALHLLVDFPHFQQWPLKRGSPAQGMLFCPFLNNWFGKDVCLVLGNGQSLLTLSNPISSVMRQDVDVCWAEC